MIFSRSQDDPVFKLYGQHVDLVAKALDQLVTVIKAFHAQDPSLKELSFQLHQTEHEADVVRRKIQDEIAAGAFLPFYREDYIVLADMVDKIANRSVDFSKMLFLQSPRASEAMKTAFEDLGAGVVETFTPFPKLIHALFNAPKKVPKLCGDVSAGEQKCDSLEWKLLKEIFGAADLPRAEQIILANLTRCLASISDAAENAADRVRTLIMKQAT